MGPNRRNRSAGVVVVLLAAASLAALFTTQLASAKTVTKPALTAAVIVKNSTVSAGSNLAGKVVFDNHTAHEVDFKFGGCLNQRSNDWFAVTLRGNHVPARLTQPVWPGRICKLVSRLVFKPGKTTYRFKTKATYQVCAARKSAAGLRKPAHAPACLQGSGGLPPLPKGTYRASFSTRGGVYGLHVKPATVMVKAKAAYRGQRVSGQIHLARSSMPWGEALHGSVILENHSAQRKTYDVNCDNAIPAWFGVSLTGNHVPADLTAVTFAEPACIPRAKLVLKPGSTSYRFTTNASYQWCTQRKSETKRGSPNWSPRCLHGKELTPPLPAGTYARAAAMKGLRVRAAEVAVISKN